MSSVNKFLKQIVQGDTVRDYAHGSQAFVADTYAYQPRYKHLFHVVFNFSPEAKPYLDGKITTNEKGDLHLFVKGCDLPQFNIDIEDRNQYNRHRTTQHRINYQPVGITFHDDQSDIIRKLWYAYYSFFYQDPEYSTNSSTLDRAYTVNDVYSNREHISWGMDRGPRNASSAKQFFTDIRVYSMWQKKFVEHTLVNPVITSFGHDRHDYADGTFMEHNMQVQYETVVYATGLVNDDSPKNFAIDHYDRTPSPITPLGGGTNSVFGQGGLLDAGLGVVESFSSGNILGGIFGLGRTVFNNRNSDFKSIITDELKQAGKDFLRGKNPLSNSVFPRMSNIVKSNSAQGNSPPPNRTVNSNTVISQKQVIQKRSTPVSTMPPINRGRSKVTLINTPNRNLSDTEGSF